MKKSLIIVCVTVSVMSLMAIGLAGQSDSVIESSENEKSLALMKETSVLEVEKPIAIDNFALDVSTRFIATISKKDLNKAVSITDIIPKDANWNPLSILKTKVGIYKRDLEQGITGNSLVLNEPQLALLKTVQYSENIQFTAQHAASWETGSFNYLVSVVPEKQTEYVEGKDALISYLRENSTAMIALLNNNQWEPGKINFTVNSQGTISKVDLTSTSGNVKVDEQMKRLILNSPGKWMPAENDKGEKVEQVLTLSFGNLGC